MKTRKYLSILFCTVLLLGLLSGCGGAGGSDEEAYTIRVATTESEVTATYKAIESFKAYLEERSGGRIQVEVLGNGVMGGEREILEAATLGTLEVSVGSTSLVSSYLPDFAFLELPFIFDSRQEAWNAIDGDVGEFLNAQLPGAGLIALGYQDNSVRSVSNNVRPINAVSDLKGLKLRVVEAPVYIDTFKILGANPVPMSFTEIYTALSQGTVDGQENGPNMVVDGKFYEVQKYYSLTQHIVSSLVATMNKDFFDSLPEDLQSLVLEAGQKCLEEEQRQLAVKLDDEFTQVILDAGVVINEIASENLQGFKDAVKPIYDSYKETLSPELFEMIGL